MDRRGFFAFLAGLAVLPKVCAAVAPGFRGLVDDGTLVHGMSRSRYQRITAIDHKTRTVTFEPYEPMDAELRRIYNNDAELFQARPFFTVSK